MNDVEYLTWRERHPAATLARVAENFPGALEFFDHQCSDIAGQDIEFDISKHGRLSARRVVDGHAVTAAWWRELSSSGEIVQPRMREFVKPVAGLWVRATCGVTSHPRRDPRAYPTRDRTPNLVDDLHDGIVIRHSDLRAGLPSPRTLTYVSRHTRSEAVEIGRSIHRALESELAGSD